MACRNHLLKGLTTREFKVKLSLISSSTPSSLFGCDNLSILLLLLLDMRTDQDADDDDDDDAAAKIAKKAAAQAAAKNKAKGGKSGKATGGFAATCRTIYKKSVQT